MQNSVITEAELGLSSAFFFSASAEKPSKQEMQRRLATSTALHWKDAQTMVALFRSARNI